MIIGHLLRVCPDAAGEERRVHADIGDGDDDRRQSTPEAWCARRDLNQHLFSAGRHVSRRFQVERKSSDLTPPSPMKRRKPAIEKQQKLSAPDCRYDLIV